MAGKIPDETLQAIRERVSIVEVVSGYVTLKRAGKNYLGLCPFHSEKTPSFTVSDERGLFHCFGCGAGGTVFTFLMRVDRIGFPDAVELLARRAGVALPRRLDKTDGGEDRQRLIDINETTQRYFRDAWQSPAGRPARQYVEKRGVGAAVIDQYGLGFCPPSGGGLARMLAQNRWASQKAIELGLIGRRADGTPYDRFWGRVTFPIRDGSGRILGFGGRTLGSDHPKYLNSPESPLFHKGHVLYGLFEARQAIRDAERIVIVEGYLDALALVEAEVGYTVASLGTALTATQLRLAKRFAPEVVAFFDGDRAGQEAAARAFAVCVETGVWGLGAFLPEGFDPDTYVRTHGGAATRSLLDQAVPLSDFFVQRLDPGPDASLPQRARAARKAGEVITRVADPVQFSLLAQRMAQQLGVDESVFREMRSATARSRPAEPASAANASGERFRPEESTLLEAMVLDRAVAQLVARRGVLDSFHSRVLAEAGRAAVTAWESHASSASVIDQLPAGLAEKVTAGLLGEGPLASGDRLQVARDCIERIERRTVRLQAGELRGKLRQAEARGDDDGLREHLKRHSDLLRRRVVGHE
jgi:DNA primase